MALSDAEKARRYRERQKAKKLAEMKRPTGSSQDYKTPFFEYFPPDEQVSSQYAQSLELCGLEPLLFEDDTGPEASTLDTLHDGLGQGGSNSPFGEAQGSSLGKAEVIIGCLLDAASDLAHWVNAYKKAELQARISELEAADVPDVAERKQAFARAAELSKMLEGLDKTVRFQFPVWKA